MKVIKRKYDYVRIKGVKYVWFKGDFVRVFMKTYKKSGLQRSAIKAECQNCGEEFLCNLNTLPECCSSKCSNKLNAPFLLRLHISIPGSEEPNLIGRASKHVCYAIKTKKLLRPTKCPSCDRDKYIEGHHPNYNRPNEIQWLCVNCHRKLHLGYVIQSELVVF